MNITSNDIIAYSIGFFFGLLAQRYFNFLSVVAKGIKTLKNNNKKRNLEIKEKVE